LFPLDDEARWRFPGSPPRDRYLIANRWVTELALLAVYLHISNDIPSRFDPIHWAFGAIKALRIA